MKFKSAPIAFAMISSVTISLIPASSLAAKLPHALVTDDRVKQVPYDPNQVYEVVGTYGYQTSIEFANDEIVKVVSLGDSIAWQTVPYQNRLFIKPVEPNAATNLTVVTDKRTYYFKLTSSKARPTQTFLVRFIYQNSGSNQNANISGYVGGGRAGASTSNGIDPARLNIDYGVSGDKTAIPLIRAFDDGQFTYFLFDQNAEIPSFYTVGPDGTESAVSPRREGLYMVIKRTASLFTLRNGDAHLCVQNNANPYRRADMSAPSALRTVEH
ncbi:TrbG/VirB9 family P-type conjugative transfer protein [Caballeronia novacaledonica]|uniref:TrbG/VirB9 family P-type conjugative transfer protein n=1 Tax=Caballeronia novacaledonica TaxID=1544861 RepID=UPI001EE1A719|nr:TrbG/VirB9 family P-type conjugative transfer protein [Caballeronia novacaledonica]GJH13561.1 TrbG/VirB9 family P-type conjugative transfer protein [Caballeronia novacaledonica]